MKTRDVRSDKKRGKCPLCHGKGVIVKVKGEQTIERRCVQCRGSGASDGGLHRK